MKREIIWLMFLTILFAIASSVSAEFPDKPINCIVGFEAGGATDIVARSISNLASKNLGQPIVVINKTGGTGSIALASVKKEKPDGYNIATFAGGIFISQLMRELPFDPIKDFTPIIGYGQYALPVLVRDDSPWKNFNELVEYAKRNPGKIRYATAGARSIFHLGMETLALQEGINWVHIPFKGGHPATMAILGGHIEVMVVPTDFKAFVRPGQLRLLSCFGQKRLPGFPEVPTWKELGYKIEMIHPAAWVGPKGIPKAVVDKLHGAFKEAMEQPEFIRAMGEFEFSIVYRSPEGLAKEMKELTVYYKELFIKSGLDKRE